MKPLRIFISSVQKAFSTERCTVGCARNRLVIAWTTEAIVPYIAPDSPLATSLFKVKP